MSKVLDNLRAIGVALTESELPSTGELRQIVGALAYAGQESVEIHDDDAVQKAVTDLRKLQVPESQQIAAEATVVPGSEQTVDAQVEQRFAALEDTNQQILALLTARAGEQPAPVEPPVADTPAGTPTDEQPIPAPAPGGEQQNAAGLEVTSSPEPDTAPADTGGQPPAAAPDAI